jgi:hypothetical protein
MPESKPAEYRIDPTFNVSLALGKNVRIEPPTMSLMVTDHGTLMGSLSDPNLNMSLEVEEGKIALAGTRLRIVPGGTITLTYAPPAPSVRVNLQAKTTVTATSELGRRQRYEITLNIVGPVTDLRIDLQSEPGGLSREQMLAALGHIESLFASAEFGLQQDIASALTAVGTSTLFAPIETIFVEELGFEEFSLEYGLETPLSIYVSRRLFGNFFVSHFQTLSGDFASVQDVEYESTFSYRFRRFYQFGASVDDQQTLTFEVGFTKAFQ